ncbi:MAG: sulfatase-like hydrolase/transferase [Parasphingorhabdus sp.]|uniref:sulfatase family protein n=1 Tax=Parasphingorhabdus sp. TaxID=2709688 RepID=UPI0030027F33
MQLRFNRRQTLAGLVAASASSVFTSPLIAKAGSDLPNIIFIMADDLGYADLGCTGSRTIKTPHIDSLAENGMLLPQGYANSSICSPTRTGLLTGCYQHRFPVGLEEPVGPWTPEGTGIPEERRTISEVLRARGYETSLVGKWHLGNSPDIGPTRHGYDHFFGILDGGADYFRHRPVMGGQDVGSFLMEQEVEAQRVGYLTDVFGDEAVNRIRNKRKPLFMSLHFTAPHWPWEGREDEQVARELINIYHYDGGSLDTYRRMVEAMDDNVGKVLAALRDRGELENTIIIFTSDNGGERFSDVWPFIGMKGELLEGGIRVPILWQWPAGSPRGVVSEQMMMSMDFLPTLLAIAGGKSMPSEFDGMDLSPQLMRGATPIERTLFWRMKNAGQAAARRGDWKFLKLGDKQQLFNLRQDQHERANLAQKNPEKMRELQSAWDAWNVQMLPYPADSYSHDNRDFLIERY